jgi:hypothetical protein
MSGKLKSSAAVPYMNAATNAMIARVLISNRHVRFVAGINRRPSLPGSVRRVLPAPARRPEGSARHTRTEEAAIVKVDYGTNRLELTSPAMFRPPSSGTTLHFERLRSIPLVDAVLDGVHGMFGVDTGARSSLLLYGPYGELALR